MRPTRHNKLDASRNSVFLKNFCKSKLALPRGRVNSAGRQLALCDAFVTQ